MSSRMSDRRSPSGDKTRLAPSNGSVMIPAFPQETAVAQLAVRGLEPSGSSAKAEEKLGGLCIALFGGLRVEFEGMPVERCCGCRVQELLCYLLLHRERPHPREVLAGVLWGGQCTTEQSKTYLRKTLWQLQSSLNEVTGAESPIVADAEWIRVVPVEGYHLDVASLEQAYALVRDVPGAHLDQEGAAALGSAVKVYTGNLLEGWYQDWCLAERERLQQIYLLMLDKLMAYCSHVGSFEAGIAYGEESLRYDRARERTYQILMSLHRGLGDRTGALRRYAQCEAALQKELDVTPSDATACLAIAIRGGHEDIRDAVVLGTESSDVRRRLDRLSGLHKRLLSLQHSIQREIEGVRRALSGGDTR